MKFVPNRVMPCFLLFANGVLYGQEIPPPPPTPTPPGTPIGDYLSLLILLAVGLAFLKFRKLDFKKA